MGSIERRRDRKRQWKARYRKPDGGWHSKSFERKVDAERFLAGIETDLARGSWVDPSRSAESVARWSERWRATKVDLRPSTLARLDSTLRSQVLPTFGERSLDSIGHGEVRAWVAGMIAAGLSVTTVRKAYFALNDMLEAAVLDRRLTHNPASRVPLPAERHHEQRFLDALEVTRLADEIRPERFRALVLVAVYGGLRFGELAGLRRKRVNMLRGRLVVAETLVDVAGHLTVGPPKTRNGQRTVPLPRSVMRELESHMLEFTEEGPEALVFTAPEGGPLRRGLFRTRYWLPAVQSIGMQGLRFHDLRHTFVSLWVAAGANAKEISVRAGHSSVAFTLDRYGHLYETADDELSERLDLLLSPPTTDQRDAR